MRICRCRPVLSAVEIGRWDVKVYYFIVKKVNKNLQAKKKYVPLQSQFERNSRETLEMDHGLIR